jgi:hypothetical protein
VSSFGQHDDTGKKQGVEGLKGASRMVMKQCCNRFYRASAGVSLKKEYESHSESYATNADAVEGATGAAISVGDISGGSVILASVARLELAPLPGCSDVVGATSSAYDC